MARVAVPNRVGAGVGLVVLIGSVASAVFAWPYEDSTPEKDVHGVVSRVALALESGAIATGTEWVDITNRFGKPHHAASFSETELGPKDYSMLAYVRGREMAILRFHQSELFAANIVGGDGHFRDKWYIGEGGAGHLGTFIELSSQNRRRD